MKKKLEETYLPEKESQGRKLVIGLSGGINSIVSAYLLKIQKYEVIAVSIAIGLDEFKQDPSDFLSCH